MKSGCKPTPPDLRDYDLLKTRKYGAAPATLPAFYSVDARLWVPNQNVPNNYFNPAVPALPYGCTDYAQCELCADEDGVLYNPAYLESITHASANGGADLRISLDAVVKNGMQDQQGNIHTNHPAYFNIRPSGAIDFFDAIRLAMLSTSSEKRGVSIGSPFWRQWVLPPAIGILPDPDYNLKTCSWHNCVVKGWDTIDGVLYLTCQMLQGEKYGKNGIAYISRERFNATMAVYGAVAFTIDKLLPNEQVETVDLNIVQMIVSYVRRLFNV